MKEGEMGGETIGKVCDCTSLQGNLRRRGKIASTARSTSEKSQDRVAEDDKSLGREDVAVHARQRNRTIVLGEGRFTSGTHEVLKESDHFHEPECGRCKALEVVSRIKEAVVSSNESTSSIISRQVGETDSETYLKIPKTGQYLQEDNTDIRLQFHCLIALAFVPYRQENDGYEVMEAFNLLREPSSDVLEPLFDHPEKNYIRGRRHGRVYRQLMFPINLWNYYDRTITGLPKTTSPAEGWHHRLNLIMGKAHPSLTDFLQKLQNDVALVSRQILKLDAGGSLRKEENYVEADKG
ncbi:hypothetical protein ANN_04283 [Periplaneta americana]|uniref:Uncharacterized protein n=1 Tax=Periplaneta americana TaxID=6978 RepID=A0ABQ8T853_PERAM|nr:hypothetical protein ANN_04283 [Periplaneta americana]